MPCASQSIAEIWTAILPAGEKEWPGSQSYKEMRSIPRKYWLKPSPSGADDQPVMSISLAIAATRRVNA